ncbi:MAG: ATP phosphoribosyltransferase [Spirochaetia bacterium]|nr:ATP phosphoribosyltransferase [Spirochaetia bacterium]
MSPFTVALPAGRMAEESVNFFSRADVASFDLKNAGRELSIYDETGEYRIILVRSQDVPAYVSHGGVDAGITGRDVLAERGYEQTVPLELGFGKCRLSVAAPHENVKDLYSKPHLKVATKYPNLAMDYFFRKGISCEIIKIHGSVEIAPNLGLSDCIVDLVSTGGTLKANRLTEMDPIMESSAMLIVNRSSFALQTERVNQLIKKFRHILEEN